MTPKTIEDAAEEYFNNRCDVHCDDFDFVEAAFKAGAKFAEMESAKVIEKLKWQLEKFKPFGRDSCNSCESGRITVFYANAQCISCNPKSYEAYQTDEGEGV